MVLAIPFTTCPKLAWADAPPLYFATMAWEPVVNVDVVKLACPLETGADPSEVRPSKNCTVPARAPSSPDSDAVKVTPCPTLEGLELLVSVSVPAGSGGGGLTVWVSTLLVEPK